MPPRKKQPIKKAHGKIRLSDSGRILIPQSSLSKKSNERRTGLPWWKNIRHAKKDVSTIKRIKLRWQYDPKKPAITREMFLGSVKLINPAETKLLKTIHDLMDTKIRLIKNITKNKKELQTKLAKIKKEINSINLDYANRVTAETNRLKEEYGLTGKKQIDTSTSRGRQKYKTKKRLCNNAIQKATEKIKKTIENKKRESEKRIARTNSQIDLLNRTLSEFHRGKEGFVVVNVRGTDVALQVNEKNFEIVKEKLMLRPQSKLGSLESKIRHIIIINKTSRGRTLLRIMKKNGITPDRKYLEKIMIEMAKEGLIEPSPWMRLPKSSFNQLQLMREEMEKKREE